MPAILDWVTTSVGVVDGETIAAAPSGPSAPEGIDGWGSSTMQYSELMKVVTLAWVAADFPPISLPAAYCLRVQSTVLYMIWRASAVLPAIIATRMAAYLISAMSSSPLGNRAWIWAWICASVGQPGGVTSVASGADGSLGVGAWFPISEQAARKRLVASKAGASRRMVRSSEQGTALRRGRLAG